MRPYTTTNVEIGETSIHTLGQEWVPVEEVTKLKTENERLRGIIRRMQSACGLPDAANACRVVLEIAREADRA